MRSRKVVGRVPSVNKPSGTLPEASSLVFLCTPVRTSGNLSRLGGLGSGMTALHLAEAQQATVRSPAYQLHWQVPLGLLLGSQGRMRGL